MIKNYFMTAILIVSCVAVVAIPLTTFVTSLEEGTRQLITSSCIYFCVIWTILILNTWRTVRLVWGYDIDLHLDYARKNTLMLVDTVHTVNQKSSSQKDDSYGGYHSNPFEAVKTKNLLNRRQTCKDQVVHWNGLLRQTEALMLVQEEVRPRVVAVGSGTNYFPSPELAKMEGKEFFL